MTRSLLEYSCTAFFFKTTETPSVSLPHWGAHLANMLLQNTFSLVLLPQTEQLRNCTRRWRDFSRGRRKRHINLKKKETKQKNRKQKTQMRRTLHKDVVEMRTSSEQQQHYDTVVYLFFFLFSHALRSAPRHPAGVVLNGRVWGSDPASESS